MALNAGNKNKLDLFFQNRDASWDPAATFPQLIRQAKAQGATDDDLKPYYEKIAAAGFNFDPNTLSVSPAKGTAGQITPVNPSVTPPDTSAKIPTQPNLPTDVPGQTIPGPSIPLGSDQGKIEQEAAREKQQGLDVLGQQRDIRQQALSGLMPILQQQAQSQFKYDLPGIKEQLQGSGILSSDSALANAVARESANLLAPQLSELQQYGLNANDLYAEGLGNVLGNQQQMQQGGLQREFSLTDYQKQADLARQIGATMVPNSPSPFLTGLQGAGTGAAIGSVVPGLGTGMGALLGGGAGVLGGLTGGKGGGK